MSEDLSDADVEYLLEEAVSKLWDYIGRRPEKCGPEEVRDALRAWFAAEFRLRTMESEKP